MSSFEGGRGVHRRCRGQSGAGLGCGSHTPTARRREAVLPTQAAVMGGQGRDLEGSDLTSPLIKVSPHSTAASLPGPGTQP